MIHIPDRTVRLSTPRRSRASSGTCQKLQTPFLGTRTPQGCARLPEVTAPRSSGPLFGRETSRKSNEVRIRAVSKVMVPVHKKDQKGHGCPLQHTPRGLGPTPHPPGPREALSPSWLRKNMCILPQWLLTGRGTGCVQSLSWKIKASGSRSRSLPDLKICSLKHSVC